MHACRVDMDIAMLGFILIATTVTPAVRVITAEVLEQNDQERQSIKYEFCTDGWMADLLPQAQRYTLDVTF